MISKLKLIIFLFVFFGAVLVAAQTGDVEGGKTLQEKITEVQQLLMTNPDQAFSQIDGLLNQVKKEGDKEGELALLSYQCWYFINKDLKKAIGVTRELQAKAKEYENVYYRAIVHEYFSNIYIRSELPDKALKEFEQAIKLLNRINDKVKKQDVVYHKANAYTIANEVYKYKKEPHEAARMLLKANTEIKKLEDSENKRLLLLANYTNLGGIYAEINIDSAEHYVNQSLLLSKGDGKPDIIQFHNYILLGYINKERKDYAKAIDNYKKAESKIPYINPTLENTNRIYGDLAEIYKNTDSLEQANHYLQQLQHSLLKQEQNKNQSLHKIIDEELLKEKNYSLYIGIGSGVLIILMSVFLVRLYRKNNLLQEQEKRSQEYLEKQKTQSLNSNREQVYKDLVTMVEKNDPDFMNEFLKAFPYFSEKLHLVNPSVVQTEIEFCTLLKLNMPTKEIARWKNIEPKTVQNRKYRIRKKLSIPDNMDIYYWFSRF